LSFISFQRYDVQITLEGVENPFSTAIPALSNSCQAPRYKFYLGSGYEIDKACHSSFSSTLIDQRFHRTLCAKLLNMSRLSPTQSVSPPSDVSPMSLPEAKQSYFSPVNSPRLDSIQELGEHLKSSDDGGRPRVTSVSSITFPPEVLTDSLKPRTHPKIGLHRTRTASPPAPR
jgi:hypothetical protein